VQVWVTLLTIAGALGGTWLGTWLVGRQAAKDLRTNIAREIEILSKLKTDSDEARLLSTNISNSIKELAEREDLRRRRARTDYSEPRLFASFGVVSLAIGMMTSWRTRGFWPPLRSLLEGLYWSTWLLYTLLLLRVLWIVFSWAKTGVKLGAVMVQWGWMKSRLGLMKARYRWIKTLVMPLYRVVEATDANSQALEAWAKENQGKDRTPEAQRQLDELMAHREKLSAMGRRRAKLARIGVMGSGSRRDRTGAVAEDHEEHPGETDGPPTDRD